MFTWRTCHIISSFQRLEFCWRIKTSFATLLENNLTNKLVSKSIHLCPHPLKIIKKKKTFTAISILKIAIVLPKSGPNSNCWKTFSLQTPKQENILIKSTSRGFFLFLHNFRGEIARVMKIFGPINFFYFHPWFSCKVLWCIISL